MSPGKTHWGSQFLHFAINAPVCWRSYCSNRIFQTCVEELQDLEKKYEALADQYADLLNRYDTNKSAALAVARRLADMQDLAKAYQKSTDELNLRVVTAKAGNTRLRHLVEKAESDVCAAFNFSHPFCSILK